MKRGNFLKLLPVAGISPFVPHSINPAVLHPAVPVKNCDTRAYWIAVMQKLANPVLLNLSNNRLKLTMPVESAGGDRRNVSHLEAFGRTLAGISPWLEQGAGESPEGILRGHYIEMVRKCISVAVDPAAPDFMNFTDGGQPLVDAAFLAHGLLRGINQLWYPLDTTVKTNLIQALKSTRRITPGNNNWVLFSAMVEIFLLKTGNEWNREIVESALKKHADWYKGDGTYGDGADFHWDYYNSFVIHPMLVDIVGVLNEKGMDTVIDYEKILNRARRYAAILERLISPEGTYPPVGRSLCYRFGVFQLLAQMALMRKLPAEISPAQVRSGLSAVIYLEFEAPGTFDSNGWLTIGMCGHQTSLGESYISTGSLYLCTTGLLPLGLPENDPFWAMPAENWTSKKIWKGREVNADHAYIEE